MLLPLAASRVQLQAHLYEDLREKSFILDPSFQKRERKPERASQVKAPIAGKAPAAGEMFRLLALLFTRLCAALMPSSLEHRDARSEEGL